MWPELYFVKQVEAAPLPVDQLLEKVAATLPDDVSVSGVSISSDPERTYQVSLSKPRRSSVYVDQYTGEITGKNQRSGFFAFMFRMHRWLLDSMNPEVRGFSGKDDCRRQHFDVCRSLDFRNHCLVAAYT